MALYSRDTLENMGFKHLGDHVQVDSSVIFIKPQNISIGHNTRIDANTVISGAGSIHIGKHVHISCHVAILGQGEVVLGDYCGLSAKVSIFSSNDDYSGEYLTGPTVPETYKNVHTSRVRVGHHAVVGAHSVVLPGVEIGDGSAIGALSLVKSSIDDFAIAVGTPAKVVKKRSDKVLALQAKFESEK